MTYYFEAGGNVKRDIINVRSIKISNPVEVSSTATDIYIFTRDRVILFYDISMLSLQFEAFHPTMQLKPNRYCTLRLAA